MVFRHPENFLSQESAFNFEGENRQNMWKHHAGKKLGIYESQLQLVQDFFGQLQDGWNGITRSSIHQCFVVRTVGPT